MPPRSLPVAPAVLAAMMLCASVVRTAAGADSLRVAAALRDSLRAPAAGPDAAGSPRPPRAPGAFDMITNLPGDWLRWERTAITAAHAPVMSIVGFTTAGTLLTDRPV